VNIILNEDQGLQILTALHEKYINTKVYFNENTEEEDRIGMTTPEELKNTFNNVLDQIHHNGLLTILDKIK
jgi:hypothetical protein